MKAFLNRATRNMSVRQVRMLSYLPFFAIFAFLVISFAYTHGVGMALTAASLFGIAVLLWWVMISLMDIAADREDEQTLSAREKS